MPEHWYKTDHLKASDIRSNGRKSLHLHNSSYLLWKPVSHGVLTMLSSVESGLYRMSMIVSTLTLITRIYSPWIISELLWGHFRSLKTWREALKSVSGNPISERSSFCGCQLSKSPDSKTKMSPVCGEQKKSSAWRPPLQTGPLQANWILF